MDAAPGHGRAGPAQSALARLALAVDADVPAIDEATFRDLAEDARQKCPVSQALSGNVEITLSATLSSS